MQTFSSEFLIEFDISRVEAPIFERLLSLSIMQKGLPQNHKGVLLESLRQTSATLLF